MAPEIPAPLPRPAVPQEPAAGNTGVPAELRYQHARPGRPQVWLLAAACGLGVLAGAAATVSYAAQYRLADAARHLALAAALEAAIPDAAALVFACLGVALALQGRRAIRARLLNVASAGASVFMNVIAAAPGWRNVAVWAMPPAAYALASDTLIGVVRTSTVDRRQDAEGPGRAAEVSLLAVLGGLALWLLRLSLAPRSTTAGFRAWVIEECPVAPGRRAARPAGQVVPGTTCRTTGRQPTAAATNATPPERPRAVRRRAPALFPARPVRRGASPGAARPRPPGSWRSSPRSTGRWPASPWHRWRGSAPCPPPGRPEHRVRADGTRRAVLSAQQQNEAEEQNSLKGDR